MTSPSTKGSATDESTISDDDLGGEAACYARLVCPDCGAVLGEYEDGSKVHSCAPANDSETPNNV
jgi:hypothetical protein